MRTIKVKILPEVGGKETEKQCIQGFKPSKGVRVGEIKNMLPTCLEVKE
jgi:hypothetical protein